MDTREEEATDKEMFRQEILDAAKRLFVNDGYDNFSMRKLADNTECSLATICLYFKNKNDLLFAICEEVAGRLFADLTNIRTAQSDPLEALRQALLHLIEFGFNNPDEYKVLFITRAHVYGTFEEFMEHESMARNSYFVFREIVNNCIETGQLLEIEIDVLTQVLTVATRGAALTVNKSSFPWINRSVLVHTLAEGLLRGYRRLSSLR